MLKKNRHTIAFAAWMTVVTYLSLATFSGKSSGWLGAHIPHLDKLVHFTFYSVATVLGFFFFGDFFKGNTKRILTVSFSFAVVYGIIIEVVQYNFFPHRSGDVYDAIANSIGAFVGVVAIKLFFRSKKEA